MGRLLTNEEIVHHINGKRDDNRIENLRAFKNKETHRRAHSVIDLNTSEDSFWIELVYEIFGINKIKSCGGYSENVRYGLPREHARNKH